MKNLYVFLLSVVVLVASHGWAQGVVVTGGTQSAAPISSATSSAPVPVQLPPPLPTPAPAPAPAATNNQPSINPASQQGQASQNGGSAANMIAAAALMAACMASQPPNMALCAMGALAAMQAGADSGAAGQSGATDTSSAFQNGATTTSPTYNPTYGSAGFASNPTVAAGMQTLASNGYSVSPAGVTNPDGTFNSASSFGGGGTGLQGFDPNQVKEAQKVVDGINADLAKTNAGMSLAAASGGGGGGASPASAGGDEGNAFMRLRNPFASNAANQAKLMAGKTVLFDGEPIGVRGNNIFEMVHDAYQKKRQGNHFIEGEEAMVRAPASVPASRLPASLPKTQPTPFKGR